MKTTYKGRTIQKLFSGKFSTLSSSNERLVSDTIWGIQLLIDKDIIKNTMKFAQLTKAQQAEIKREYKGWPEKDLIRATWTQSPDHLVKQGFGKWCADFNTKVKF